MAPIGEFEPFAHGTLNASREHPPSLLDELSSPGNAGSGAAQQRAQEETQEGKEAQYRELISMKSPRQGCGHGQGQLTLPGSLDEGSLLAGAGDGRDKDKSLVQLCVEGNTRAKSPFHP